MKGWNPFGKVDMEIGSFIKKSVFNKEYKYDETSKEDKNLNMRDRRNHGEE